MHVILAIASITYKEGIRHRVLYGTLVLSAILLLFSVLISGLFMRDILKVQLDICLAAVSLGGLLIPFFLAIDLLARDIESRTIYTILAKPVSRAEYILGKFFGFGLLTAVIMAIFTLTTFLGVWFSTILYPQYFFTYFSPAPILLAILASFLSILVLNSTVMLWCCLTTSSFLATLLTISTYIIGQSVENMVRFISAEVAGVTISPLIKQIVSATMYIFPNLASFDMKQQAVYGIDISLSQLLYTGIYAAGYIAVMLLLAIIALTKRDLP